MHAAASGAGFRRLSGDIESTVEPALDIHVVLDWPSLPQNRRAAARRASELCTIHATLTHSPTVTVTTASEDTEHAHHHAGAPA